MLITCGALGCSFDPSGPGAGAGDAQVTGDGAANGDSSVNGDGSTLDGALFDAAPLGPWGNVQLISALSDLAVDDDPTVSGDLLELYFNSNRLGGLGGGDIWVSKRASAADPWPAPTLDSVLSTAGSETTPEISFDGLTMFTSRDGDIYVSTRTNRQTAWSTPVLVDELNTGSTDAASAPNAALTRIVLTSDRGGLDADIYESTRGTPSDTWSTPALVAGVNSGFNDYSPFLDPAGRVMYFDANPTGLDHDLFVTSRSAVDQPFAAPTRIDELSTIENETDPWVSPDGRYMVFERNVAGNAEIFEASR
jgi:Tol biopolymer transport system component